MTAAKVGMDDYFVAGGTLEQLLQHSVALSTFELAQPKRGDDLPPYAETEHGLVWHKRTNEGTVPIPLANFTAVIVADILQDDGVETVRLYELDAVLRKRTHRFSVQASQFSGLTWVAEYLGASAIIEPGQGLRERLRVAIQALSTEIASRTEYAHTGWRQIGETWVYLHAGGAIGENGPVAGVVVTLSGSLSRYRLPDPPQGHERLAAVRASMTLLDLLPFELAVPLLAVTYLAPLRELLGGEPPDFVLWLHGPSGTFKSEMAALALGHFGDFTRQSLPASFAATANAIERLLSSTKDALFVVDDYHPASDAREAAAMSQVASRLLRGVGNSSGRTRMRADTSLRPELRPRGMVLATGERLPDGHSTAARMFPIGVTPGSLVKERLSQAQRNRQQYPLAMAAYLQYLAGRIDELRIMLPARFQELRQQAARSGGHTREPGQAAHLQLALECWLTFAVEIGVLTETRKAKLLERAWQVLLTHAAEHGRDLAEETPVRRLLALLSDGFAGKRAYLEAPGGGPPEEAERWGWEVRPATDRDGNDTDEVRHLPSAALVGVLEDDWLLLFPDATYQFIQAAARTAGNVFPVDLKTLTRRLDEAGLIATEASSGRRIVNVWTGSGTRRVIKLARTALIPFSPSQDGEYGECREGDAGSRAESTPRGTAASGNEEGNCGNESGPSGNAEASQQLAIPPIPEIPADGGERDRRGLDDADGMAEWSA